MTGAEPPDDRLDSTAALLARARAGDDSARDHLLARYLPVLTRWAHGRLPRSARDLADTQDLVQVTLIRALSHLERFEPRRPGAFLSYLRQILLNALRDEVRRVGRRPAPEEMEQAETEPAEVERESAIRAYAKALEELPEEQQEAVILRVEFGFTHQEVADALGKASPDAARMMVARALVRLAGAMDEGKRETRREP